MAASLSSEDGSAESSSEGGEPALEMTGQSPVRPGAFTVLRFLVALGMLAFVITADAGRHATLAAVLLGIVGLGGSVVLAGRLAVCSIVRRSPVDGWRLRLSLCKSVLR